MTKGIISKEVGMALGEIIIRSLAEMRLIRANLEIEEGGREIASLQGKLAGYKKLLGHISAEFHLREAVLEDTGDSPRNLRDLNDEQFEQMRHEVEEMRISDPWKAVVKRVDEQIAGFKDFLLYRAEKSRDLDLKQGDYKAQTSFNPFFESVREEADWRKAEEARRAKEKAESLDFDSTDNPKPRPKKEKAVADKVVPFPKKKDAKSAAQ